MVKASEELGKNSVQFSINGIALSNKSISDLLDLSIDSAKSASGLVSRAGEYSVEKVKSAAVASNHLIELTVKKVRTNTVIVVNFSFDASTKIGAASLEAARSLLLVGRNLVVATSASGIVIVTDSTTASQMIASGEISEGSKVMVASLGRAAKTFGSEIVRDVKVENPSFPSGNDR
jgi:hypothetical protein